MTYNITDKLNFDEDPIIEVKGKKVTVKADADIVIELMFSATEKGEVQAALDAFELLFSEKDQKTIKGLHLKFEDYLTFMTTALNLAIGEDPDEKTQGEA